MPWGRTQQRRPFAWLWSPSKVVTRSLVIIGAIGPIQGLRAIRATPGGNVIITTTTMVVQIPVEQPSRLIRQGLMGETASGVCIALGTCVEELAGEVLVHEGAVLPAGTVATQVELAQVGLAWLRHIV